MNSKTLIYSIVGLAIVLSIYVSEKQGQLIAAPQSESNDVLKNLSIVGLNDSKVSPIIEGKTNTIIDISIKDANGTELYSLQSVQKCGLAGHVPGDPNCWQYATVNGTEEMMKPQPPGTEEMMKPQPPGTEEMMKPQPPGTEE